MNIRIRFGKEGMMRYIGHLDVLRTFQKIFRRAGIPMQYSQGYSPHPVMSFALPLGLGLTSEGEYLDVSVEDGAEPEQMRKALQEATAEELPVYSLHVLPEKAEAAMAAVGGAVYQTALPETLSSAAAKAAVRAVLNRETIVLPKKTKTREIMLDIRPMIYSLGAEDRIIRMTLAAGSRANLSPETVLELFAKEAGISPTNLRLRIRRMDLLDHEGRSLALCGKEEGWGD